jgi:hypothetical protein
VVRHAAERVEAPLSAAFLRRTDHGVGEDHNEDDHRIAGMSEGESQGGRDEEEINQGASELL